MLNATSRRPPRARATALSALLSGLAMALLSPAVDAAVLQSKSFEYDAQGRVTVERDAANAVLVTHTYDGNGNRLSVTDALGRSTTYGYDALNRLVQESVVAGGQAQATTQYGYDGRDNLVSVTDPRGLTTTYTYNGLDQLTAQHSPDTGTTTYAPNAAGQVLVRTNAAGQATTYQYDALGRVTQASYADGRTVTYAYDQGANGVGRLASVSDGQSSLSWTYDADGRVLSRTQMVAGGPTLTLAYGYNAAGQLTSLTLPGGAVVAYGYDDQGRVASLSHDGAPVLTGLQYRPFGGITGWTWGNGQLHTRSYDQNGRPDLVSVGATVQDLGYDAASRIDAIVDLADASQNRSFSYDALDRLTGYSGQASSRSWSYDAVGNRTGQVIGSATETYGYAATSNRLLSLVNSADSGANRSYGYTPTGHISTDGVNSYGYDARERLTTATTPAASASYVLNPLGQRVQKQVTQGGATVTTTFLYDEAGHLVAEVDAAGTTTDYLWLGDVPVALVVNTASGSTRYHVHADYLNTPRQVTTSDAQNTVVWRWEGEPFGSTLADSDPDQDGQVLAFNLRFPGQYYDAETRLHYNYYRDYDPAIGRYIESDPIGLDGGLNTYGYVDQDPLSYADFYGLARGGERGATGGSSGQNSDNPYKHCRNHPTDPTKIECKHHQTGKWITKPKPADWPNDKKEMCGDDCKVVTGAVLVGGTWYLMYRCGRMLPSLLPPLWPTIPANLAVP